MPNHSSGRNQRVIDGYLAYQEVMSQMRDARCRGLLHGGDLFHESRPRPRDIDAALGVDDERYNADMWGLVNTGNHDAGASVDTSAVAVLHRPAMKSHAVYNDSRARRVGPHPGLYEIHRPDPDVPLYLHVVSHFGLDPAWVERGIVIDPRPRDDGVNILCSHGIFHSHDRLYRATERNGAERTIPLDWVGRGWDLTLLSDFHTPARVRGFGDEDGRGQVWYTGSTVRRGFSDDESARGWLRVDIADNGVPTVSLQTIWQRPQRDFTPIDARGKTVAQINDLVHRNLKAQVWVDPEAQARTGHGGWILRQRITGTTPGQRTELNELLGKWAAAAREAAFWQAVFDDNAAAYTGRDVLGTQASITDRVTDFATALTARAERGTIAEVLAEVPATERNRVLQLVYDALGSSDKDSSATP